MKNKKVLVTGADGFIGSHLAELLVERGFDTRALVVYNSSSSWGWLDRVSKKVLSMEIVLGDIRDPTSLKQSFQAGLCAAFSRLNCNSIQLYITSLLY